MTTSEPQLWRITIPVIATDAEVDELTERLIETLCPDREHEGPCRLPWAMTVTDGGSLSKAEQRRMRDAIAGTNP